MKKFVTYIFAFICLLSAGVLSACTPDEEIDASIYFNESYLELNIGDTLDLTEQIYFENIELDDIEFSSLDKNIVVITNGQLTAVGAGSTLIRAESEYATANLEIKVNATATNVNVPTGLIYDLKEQCVSWNHVLVKVGDKIQEVNSYTVSLTSEGSTKEYTVIGSNQYKIQEGGNFTIKVKCNPLVMDGVTIYGGSEYSSSINVKQLSKPTNIKYNDETNILSWECEEDVESFQVKINGVLYQSTKEKEFIVDLSSKQDTNKQQTYKVSVVSEKAVGQQAGDVVAQAESDAVTYTRLYAPKLNINNGVVTWDNSQQGNFHFEIVAVNSSGTSFTIPIQNNQFSATQLTTGTYSQITIRALGDDNYHLDSINESKLENVVKLAPATISYNPVTQVITASNHGNKNVELHITYKNSTEKIKLPKPSYQYTWQKTAVGDYTVQAYVYADTNNVTEINSEVSNQLTLKQLAQVDSVTVAQKVENGKYYLDHSTVENATLYEYAIKIGSSETYVLKQNDGSLGEVDNLFSTVGTYSVTITASSTQNLGTNTFVLPSKTNITVVRQADVATLTYSNNNVNWSAVSTANSYSYYANKNGSPHIEQTTTTANSFSTLHLSYGDYKFFVKANGWSNTSVLYLDSLNYTEVDFSLVYTLDTPELAFDRETYIATFNKVENALDYIVTLNEDFELAYYELDGKLAVNLSNKLNNVGNYIIQVQAVNNDDELILNSQKNQIAITKLAAPTTFNLSADGILKITNVPSSTMLNAVTPQILTINDQSVKLLDKTSSAYEVKAQFIANNQRVGTNYYLDSDVSVFTITRLSTPQKPVLNETIISWLELQENNFEYKINVTQNDTTKSIALTENQIDVFDSKLGSINLSTDFTVSVGYEYKGADINLANGRDIKFTSFYSETTLIHKIKSDVKMYIAETSSATTVNWEESTDVEDVTYELFLDGTSVYVGQATSYDLTESIMSEKDYTLRLRISKAGYLDSEYVEIHLERLINTTTLNIDENENIYVTTNYTPEQLEKIKITKDGAEITSLAAFSGKFEVKVQLIAKTYTEGEYYYLSSEINTFNFTRISTLSQPLVDDNAISWDSINGVNDFRLVFEAGETSQQLDLSNQNSIAVTTPSIQKIFKALNSNEMTLKIKAVVDAFVANKDQEYLLSSYFSENSRITLLQAVQNIKLESNTNDAYQQDIRISWDFNFAGVEVKQTDLDIYHNGQIISQESIVGTATSVVAQNMREPGTYYVKIRVLGDSYCIDSEYATSQVVTRLEAPTNLAMDENCIFNWTGVNNATCYNVSYYYNEQINGELSNVSKTTWDLSEEMYKEQFGGYITFNVVAVGGQGKDEYRTLSSPLSENYIVTKLPQGSIRLSADHLLAGGEVMDEFDETSKYLITISNNDRLVFSKEFSHSQKYEFGDFEYLDTKEKVDTLIEQDFVITVQRINNESNYIKSDILERKVVKLKQPDGLGFIRKADGKDTKIWLQVNLDGNATGYRLRAGEADSSNFTETGLIAEIPLVDEIYNQIPAGDIEFKVNKKGFITESGISYIDSSPTIIVARKLETPQNFGARNGVICWDMVDRATDYLVKVTANNKFEILDGYIKSGVHTLTEKFEDFYGDMRLNIKAKGNVGTTLMKTDVILDSSYLLSDEDKDGKFEVSDYQCQKLQVPSNFRGVNGYLGVTEDRTNSISEDYQAIIDGNYYNLRKVGTYDGNTYTLLYSDSMYESLQDNTKYLVRVRAVSSSPKVIYSEESTSIYIKIIPNTIRGTLEFVLKLLSEDPVKYDYSKSQIQWAEAINATNGYKVNINGREFETDLTTYDLESEEYTIQAGQRNFVKVLIKGDSFLDSDGCYKLDSMPTEALEFFKLMSPEPSVADGMLTWTTVSNATGYLIYLDDKLLFEDPISTTVTAVDLGDISGNLVYSEYEVRAVSTDGKYIASDPGLYKDELDNAKAVTKLHSPIAFTLKDGVLLWELTEEAIQNYIWGRIVDMPFTFDVTMVENSFPEKPSEEEEEISNEGEDTGDGTGEEDIPEEEPFNIYEYIAQSSLYIEMKLINNDTQIETILKLNPMLFLSIIDEELAEEAKKYSLVGAGGWPTLTYGYDDSNWNPECGSYTYYLRQPGDSVEYLESNFSMPQDLYIPHAPQIKVTYSTNLYTLKWDAITIPSYYNMPNPTYQMIVETESGERIVLKETTETSINLTELIENGTLTADHKKVYVSIKGNSVNVLNGKKSNIITLQVLDAIEAFVKDGEIQWKGQDSAGEYIITYTEANNPASKTIITRTNLIWDCAELDSSVEYYDVTINAVGQTITTYTHATLTGPTTKIGRIKKLDDPDVSIDDGVFKWLGVNDCQNYFVYATPQSGEMQIKRVSGLTDSEGYVWYETDISPANIFYTFRAIGDMDLQLAEDSMVYVNSNMTGETYGSVLNSIKGIRAINGELVWDVVKNSELFISFYKLTFNKINENGEIVDSSQVIKGGNFRDSADSLECSYDVADLPAGKYRVVIQPYYPTEREEGKYIYQSSQAFYLLGLAKTECKFEKYETVHGFDTDGSIIENNLSILDGEFKWEYAGDIDLENYEYELQFTSSIGEKIVFKQAETNFVDFIKEQLVPTESYELKIRVVPKPGVEGYVSSDFITFRNKNNYDLPTIYQLNAVQESDIILTRMGTNDDIYINWEGYQIATGDTDLTSMLNVEYKLTYWTEQETDEGKVTGEKQEIITTDKYFNTVNMSFNITEGHTLYYTLQVFPQGVYSYIPSCVSEVRDIKKPDSVDEVTYDPITQTFSWVAETTTTDHCFKIKDEILQTDSNGKLVVDENGEPIVIRTYIYTTVDNDTRTYVPIEQGWHKVSVAVTIRTSGNTGGLDSEYKYYYEYTGDEEVDAAGVVKGTPRVIDLFELAATDVNTYGASGTENNPYIISNATQFANIAYRLNKPSYQNSYFLTVNGVTSKVTLEAKDYTYHFKQSGNITGAEPFGKGETVKFSGVYDGDYNMITWNCDLSQMIYLSKKYMSLFSELTSTAVIKNLQVRANFTNELTAGGTLSMLCFKNAGTITNVVIGSVGDTLEISNQEIFWNGVCNENSGTISNVVNYYSVTLKSTRVGYSGITSNNNDGGIISCCANYGDIALQAITTTSAGIVGTNSGVVERCVLKNTVTTITIPKVSGSVSVYFGGIVGNNKTTGSIEYCYVDTSMVVYREALNTSSDRVYMAGVVGYSANDNISRCYVNITIDATSADTVEIGNLYLFAYISSVSAAKDTFCYCNTVTLHSPVGGDNNFSVTEYTDKPYGSNMNEAEKQYYTNNENNMPVLVWENEFKALWAGKLN